MLEQRNFEIPKPFVGQAGNAIEKEVDANTRRWIWSPLVDIETSRVHNITEQCGYNFIPARVPIPIETVQTEIPLEVPAQEVRDGNAINLAHGFTFGTKRKLDGKLETITYYTKTAKQIVRDLCWVFTGSDRLGFSLTELTELAGWEAAQVETVLNEILPVEYRETLIDVIAYLQLTLVALPKDAPFRLTMQQILDASLKVETVFSGYLDESEMEVAERASGSANGKKRLDAFDLYLMRELKRTPKEMKIVKANEQIAENVKVGIIEGMKALREVDSQAAMQAKLDAQNAEIQELKQYVSQFASTQKEPDKRGRNESKS